jgi:hypothetical protein
MAPMGSQKSTIDNDKVQPLYPNAPLLLDSNMDLDWAGDWEDFQFEGPCILPSSPEGSFTKDPISELGLYDPHKDLSGWTFNQLWHDR